MTLCISTNEVDRILDTASRRKRSARRLTSMAFNMNLSLSKCLRSLPFEVNGSSEATVRERTPKHELSSRRRTSRLNVKEQHQVPHSSHLVVVGVSDGIVQGSAGSLRNFGHQVHLKIL